MYVFRLRPGHNGQTEQGSDTSSDLLSTQTSFFAVSPRYFFLSCNSHVLIISTSLIFIQANQGHIYLSHENNKYLIIAEAIKAMPIKFAVKTVRLKVHITIASQMTLTFIQGYKCVSNLITG